MSKVKLGKTSSSEESLKFSSTEHAQSVLESLNGLRKSEMLCDIQIEVGNKTFQAHRAILSASSPFFEAMFTNGLRETKMPVIQLQLESQKEETFGILIDFIYTGSIEIKEDNVQDLLVSADMLQLAEVVGGCCTFLKKELHASNCIGIYRFAEAHACVDLKEAAETYMCQNFLCVAAEEEFFEMPKDMLQTLLGSERLCIDDEVQVFHATMGWIFHNLKQRRQYIFQLLQTVRLPLIPDSFLDVYARECSDLSLRVALTKLLEDHRSEMRLLSTESRLGHTTEPLPRTCPRAFARKNIFVVGGFRRTRGCRWSDSRTLNVVEVYDTYKERWDTFPTMRVERSCHGVASLNGLVYAVGGESDDSSIFSHGEVYNPTTRKWSFIQGMTTPRTSLGLVALYNKLYAIGGWIGCDVGASIEEYDPDTLKWTTCGVMMTPRCAMGTVVHQGLIYIVGGLSDMQNELDSLECYNPITKEWNQLARLKHPKAYIGVAILNNYMYVVGGLTRTDQVINNVERYSFEANKWEEITPMKWERAAPSVAAVNGLLYVIGGRTAGDQYSAATTYDVVECFDPEKNTWVEILPVPTCRSEAGVVVL